MTLLTRHEVASPDGTRIGYETRGHGPMLVAVHGATADRSRWTAIAPQLAQQFTLLAMDRRGRGLSRDAPGRPYAIEREVEDLRAVIDAACAAQDGAPVYLFGHSFGGLCALDAACGNASVAKLLVYEPAFSTAGHEVIGPRALAELIQRVDAGRFDAALEFFFADVIGVEPMMITAMRFMPSWQQRLEAVPALVREGRAANAWQPAALHGLSLPVRFLVGSISPPWLRAAAYAAQAATPGSDIVELPGQAHGAMDTAPALIVEEVCKFWNAAP